MSIVAPALPGAVVLDLFAGSGALGLEALSRGAARADLVDRSPRALEVLRLNVATLGAATRATIVRADAIRFTRELGALAYDVAFADPPFASDAAALLAGIWLAVPFARVLGIEHAATLALPGGGDTRRYGTVGVTFYRACRP